MTRTGVDREPTCLLTVIVVAWNSEDSIRACLRSVQGSDHDCETIVIDNRSSDASATIADETATVVVRLDSNVGFPSAVNRALAVASGQYVLLLNPDVIVEDRTIGACLQALSDTAAGIVGANLRAPDGSPDRAAARRFKSMRTVLIETVGLPRLSKRFDWQYFPRWDRTDSREVPCINGAFMLMRTDLLKELGGLNDSVFMYLEDLDLCWRVRERGLAIWFCADAAATHIGGASTAAGSVEQQAIAHLHRLDGTIEFITRTSRFGIRSILVGLLLIQSLTGLAVGLLTRDRVQAARHRRALRWLPRQIRSRTPPPPVSR